MDGVPEKIRDFFKKQKQGHKDANFLAIEKKLSSMEKYSLNFTLKIPNNLPSGVYIFKFQLYDSEGFQRRQHNENKNMENIDS